MALAPTERAAGAGQAGRAVGETVCGTTDGVTTARRGRSGTAAQQDQAAHVGRPLAERVRSQLGTMQSCGGWREGGRLERVIKRAIAGVKEDTEMLGREGGRKRQRLERVIKRAIARAGQDAELCARARVREGGGEEDGEVGREGIEWAIKRRSREERRRHGCPFS